MLRDWYFLNGSREVGPLALHDLATMARRGGIVPQTQVRQGRSGQWIAAVQVKGIFSGAVSRPPPLPAPGAIDVSDADRAALDAKVGGASRDARPLAPWGLIALAATGVVVLGIVGIVAMQASRSDDLATNSAPRQRDSPRSNSVSPIAAPTGKDTPDTTVAKSIVRGPLSGETSTPDASSVPSDWIEQLAERSNRSVVRIETSEGLGTGFVIASRENRRLLLTNRHVVTVGEDSRFSRATVPKHCRVVFPSKTAVVGQVAALAKNSEVDLALVLIETSELQILAPIESFDSVKVGEQVVAIGNPLGLDNSITQGIISAKREEMLLQTSAPINHGNSGGPLVNKYGHVVGVNTLTGDSSKGVQGIGFAFRADIALRRADWNCLLNIDDLLESVPH